MLEKRITELKIHFQAFLEIKHSVSATFCHLLYIKSLNYYSHYNKHNLTHVNYILLSSIQTYYNGL